MIALAATAAVATVTAGSSAAAIGCWPGLSTAESVRSSDFSHSKIVGLNFIIISSAGFKFIKMGDSRERLES